MGEDEQMLRRSVNGEASCALQASSPPQDQSKQEQEEGEGELAAYPDNFCDGRQDLTFTSSCLAKRSRQTAKKETEIKYWDKSISTSSSKDISASRNARKIL